MAGTGKSRSGQSIIGDGDSGTSQSTITGMFSIGGTSGIVHFFGLNTDSAIKFIQCLRFDLKGCKVDRYPGKVTRLVL